MPDPTPTEVQPTPEDIADTQPLTQLVDVKTGQLQGIPAAHAEDALRSGAYTLAAGSQVPIKVAGKVQTVPAEQAMAAMTDGTASLATPDEQELAAKQERRGGALQTGLAALEGAGRSASLGGTDWLGRAIGGQDYANAAREREEVHPYAEGAGEAAGLIAPALFGDEAGILGRAGDLVEHGIAKILPEEASSLAGRLAVKAATVGSRGAVEGGLLGLQQYGSEQALSTNPTLDGEKLLAAIGHGALLGGVGGGLLGAGGELGSEVVGRLAPKLSRLSDEQAWRSLNPIKKWANRAAEVEGGTAAIGAEVKPLLEMGDNLEQIATKVEAKKAEVGAVVGSLRDKLDEAGAEGPKLENIFKPIDDHIEDLSKLKGLNKGAINQLETLKDDLREAAGLPRAAGAEVTTDVANEGELSFKAAADIKARVNDLVKRGTAIGGPVNEAQDALKKVAGSIEDEIERAGDAAAKKSEEELGESWLDEYKKAKDSYRKLSLADNAAQDGLRARAANRKFSPTDYGIGAIGAMLGGGGPLGAVTGLASTLAHHVVRERGNSTAALLLDKLAAMGGAQRAIAATERQTTRGVLRAIGDTSLVRVSPKAPIGGSFEEKRDAVLAATINAEDHAMTVNGAVAPLTEHAPQIAKAFSAAALNSTKYLAAQLPKPSDAITPNVTPKLAKYEPPASEKAAFNRKFDAVNDPAGTLARIENHTLAPDEVSAIKATHPEWYAKTCADIKDGLKDATKDLPAARLQALSVWCGEPLTPMMNPDFIRAMQDSHAKRAAQSQPRSRPSKAANPSNLDRIKETTGLAGLSK
jgi:hypothetical protein